MEHFSCAKCEKPFLGGRHFEKAGLAYCETHFLQLFGSVCHLCDKVSCFRFFDYDLVQQTLVDLLAGSGFEFLASRLPVQDLNPPQPQGGEVP